MTGSQVRSLRCCNIGVCLHFSFSCRNFCFSSIVKVSFSVKPLFLFSFRLSLFFIYTVAMTSSILWAFFAEGIHCEVIMTSILFLFFVFICGFRFIGFLFSCVLFESEGMGLLVVVCGLYYVSN